MNTELGPLNLLARLPFPDCFVVCGNERGDQKALYEYLMEVSWHLIAEWHARGHLMAVQLPMSAPCRCYGAAHHGARLSRPFRCHDSSYFHGSSIAVRRQFRGIAVNGNTMHVLERSLP